MRRYPPRWNLCACLFRFDLNGMLRYGAMLFPRHVKAMVSDSRRWSKSGSRCGTIPTQRHALLAFPVSQSSILTMSTRTKVYSSTTSVALCARGSLKNAGMGCQPIYVIRPVFTFGCEPETSASDPRGVIRAPPHRRSWICPDRLPCRLFLGRGKVARVHRRVLSGGL